MKQKIILIALCLIFGGSAVAQDMGKKGGNISGKVKAKRSRDSRGIVVYLEKVEGKFEPLKEKPVMDQKDLTFIPHILPVLVGSTIKFPNNDNVKHNVFSPSKVKKFNLGTYGAGVTKEATFDKPGVVALLCNVHSEMMAFIIVLENPYYAVTGSDGIFTINDVPSGTYTIKAWHERLKAKKQEITVIDGKTITVDFKLSR